MSISWESRGLKSFVDARPESLAAVPTGIEDSFDLIGQLSKLPSDWKLNRPTGSHRRLNSRQISRKTGHSHQQEGLLNNTGGFYR